MGIAKKVVKYYNQERINSNHGCSPFESLRETFTKINNCSSLKRTKSGSEKGFQFQLSSMDNIDLAKKILARHKITSTTLVPLTGGQVNLIYKIDNGYILRIGRDKDSSRRLQHEFDLFKSLKDKIPVPEICNTGEFDGNTYQIQKLIPGILLSRIWRELTSKVKELLVKEIVTYLKILHQITFDNYGLQYSGEKYTRWVEFWEDKIRLLKVELSSIQTYLPEDILNLVFKHFETNKHLLGDGKPVFIHGDFWPGNILVHKNKVSGFLDFEFASQAPKEYELLSIERFCLYPNDYEDEGKYTSTDFIDFAVLFKKYYPEILEIKNLRKRLDLYQMIRCIESHIGYLERHLLSPEKYFPINPVAKITNFLYQEGARIF
ncbi:MAG: phosphotransferase family protein [Patescibacteria group bacterium]